MRLRALSALQTGCIACGALFRILPPRPGRAGHRLRYGWGGIETTLSSALLLLTIPFYILPHTPYFMPLSQLELAAKIFVVIDVIGGDCSGVLAHLGVGEKFDDIGG